MKLLQGGTVCWDMCTVQQPHLQNSKLAQALTSPAEDLAPTVFIIRWNG